MGLHVASRNSLTDTRASRAFWYANRPPDGAQWIPLLLVEGVLAAFGGAGNVLSTGAAGRTAQIEAAAIGGIAGVLAGLGLLYFLRLGWGFFWAPSWQRDDARQRVRAIDPDNPFAVASLHEEGFFGLDARDPVEQYVRLGITVTRRIERVSVRVVELYEIMNGAPMRLADFDPVNLTWSSRETQAIEGRQFLNLSPDGAPRVVDVAVCGRALGSRNIRLVAANDHRPALPAADYKIVILVTSDSPDKGVARLEYGLYRIDRQGLGTTLFLQDWGLIGGALLEATRRSGRRMSTGQQ